MSRPLTDRAADRDPKERHDLQLRAGSVLLGGTVVVVMVVMVLRTVAHAGEAVYDLPAAALVTVCVAAALAICGAIGMMLTSQPAAAFSSALVPLLFAAGVLAILSIGALLLVAAVTVLVVVVRRAGPITDRAAVLSGIVLSLGFVSVAFVSSTPPIVECSDGGVRTSSRAWWGGDSAGSSSGCGTSTPDDTASGTLSVGSRTYSYTCRDGRLATFVEE